MELNVFQSQPGSFEPIGYDESCQLKTSNNNLTQNEIYKKSYNRCCDTRTTVNNEMFYLDQYERINICPDKRNGTDFDNTIETFADPSDPSNKISEEQILKIQTSQHPPSQTVQVNSPKKPTANPPTKQQVKPTKSTKTENPTKKDEKEKDKKKDKKKKNKWSEKYYDEYDQYYDYDISYFPYYFPPPIPDYVPYESPPVYPMNMRPGSIPIVSPQSQAQQSQLPDHQSELQSQFDNNTVLYIIMVLAFLFLLFVMYKFLL